MILSPPYCFFGVDHGGNLPDSCASGRLNVPWLPPDRELEPAHVSYRVSSALSEPRGERKVGSQAAFVHRATRRGRPVGAFGVQSGLFGTRTEPGHNPNSANTLEETGQTGDEPPLKSLSAGGRLHNGSRSRPNRSVLAEKGEMDVERHRHDDLVSRWIASARLQSGTAPRCVLRRHFLGWSPGRNDQLLGSSKGGGICGRLRAPTRGDGPADVGPESPDDAGERERGRND
jgi:hypothetical protein